MKTIKISIVVCIMLFANTLFAQEVVSNSDSTGLPGDNFSLQGALDLFKSSSTLEEFEKKLNTEDLYVNNLDLNGDGEIDFIRVIDHKKDDAHAIVLQALINEKEFQDVAVIEIEKTANENASVQIIGDEELYGNDMIIEPFEENTSVKTKSGPSYFFSLPARVIVNVWFWPLIQFIYSPAYVVWVSPWKWHHYPAYWKPWTPHPWYWHHNHCNHYNAHYYHAPKHRLVVAHQVYAPHRKTSVVVVNRYKRNHENYNAHRGTNVNNKPVNNPHRRSSVGKPANNTRVKPNKAISQKPIKTSNGGGRTKSLGGGNGKRK